MRGLLLTSTLLFVTLASCKAAPPPDLPPPHPGASALATTAPSASAAPVASAAAVDPFFGPTQLPGTRPRETVRDAGGVLLGVPEGWVTYSVYDAYDMAVPKLGELQQAGAYYMALDEKVGAAGKLDLAELSKRVYALHVTKPSWDAPFEARVGVRGYHGQIVRGRGVGLSAAEGEKEAFAAVVQIPTRKPILFLAAWAKAHPEHEQRLVDMLRALAPCEFKPAKGCLAIAP